MPTWKKKVQEFMTVFKPNDNQVEEIPMLLN